ncbi:hypothetical protein P2318_13330 [Myxococcaceae bacterium GXIMD 01537]
MFDYCATCDERGEALEIFDWCAHCERSLCPHCMERGCCDSEPARSGQLAHGRRDEEVLDALDLRHGGAPGDDDDERGSLPEHFGGRCCGQARARQCSCAFHWSCPHHGDQHIGTHD